MLPNTAALGHHKHARSMLTSVDEQDPSPLARLDLHPPRLVSFRAACARLKGLAGSQPPQQGPGPSSGGYSAINQLLRPAQHGLEAEVERLQAQVLIRYKDLVQRGV